MKTTPMRRALKHGQISQVRTQRFRSHGKPNPHKLGYEAPITRTGWWFYYVLTILKKMSSSMGRMTSHIIWKIKFMIQTTNQMTMCPLIATYKGNCISMWKFNIIIWDHHPKYSYNKHTLFLITCFQYVQTIMIRYLYDPLCFFLCSTMFWGGASDRSPNDPQPGESMTTTAGAPGLCVSTRLARKLYFWWLRKLTNLSIYIVATY